MSADSNDVFVQSVVMRLCSRCKVEKPESEFYVGQKRPCKECQRARMRQYRQRPEVKANIKEYNQKPEVKEKVKEKSKTPEARNRLSARKKWANQMYKLLKLTEADY
jgi:hypothetical protein